MKKILIFIAILGAGFARAGADDFAAEIARAAAPQSARQEIKKQDSADNASAGRAAFVAARSNNIQQNNTQRPDSKTDTTSRRADSATNVSARTAVAAPTVSQRNNAAVSERENLIPASAGTPPPLRGGQTAERSGVGSITAARTAISRGASEPTPRTAVPSAPPRKGGGPVADATVRSAISANRARAAIDSPASDKGAATGAAAVNYKKCREVYYQCMDEFCANKNSQLKRCACSTRVHEFDGVAKQMTKVEDAMLDFNERLLTVNMEKEDAAAISKATAGELAFQQDDKSASKKILDEISKKLKSSTADNEMNRNMAAISLSLDMDSAFDTIDSLMGANTATKEGAALYNAALPVCREMAAEVCDSADAAAIAESGYQMMIEQDCNTVSKAYDTKMAQAKDKVFESSALLDMSRLDIYQKRNSDDILTCKKKMLDYMADPAVCGVGLGKCLDTTGRYIDPATGAAFLTPYLADLANSITRPTSEQKWSTVPGNSAFVSFLNKKKKYLEPAMENCQKISDTVWRDFIDDAIAQIKLAQGAKLEEMRQSCTTLTTQCLSDTAKSISEFDARALSVFGVVVDRTVNDMCASVRESCVALLGTTAAPNWETGMTGIADDKTYDKIIATCREVGKACIVQTCKSVSGNFGLCENVDTSVNRKSVINRSACWNDVQKCVADAGADVLARILSDRGKTGDLASSGTVNNLSGGAQSWNFYYENYSNLISGNTLKYNDITYASIYDMCQDCSKNSYGCGVCRLSEKIWGNCEISPVTNLAGTAVAGSAEHNYILQDNDKNSLLWWFAENTYTTDNKGACKDTSCSVGQSPARKACGSSETICSVGGATCGDDIVCTENQQITVATGYTNTCESGVKDAAGNCCVNGVQAQVAGINSAFSAGASYFGGNTANKTAMCSTTSTASLVAAFKQGSDMMYLLCIGGSVSGANITTNFPKGQQINCDGRDGRYVIFNATTGTYQNPSFSNSNGPAEVSNYYHKSGGQCEHCEFNFNGGANNYWPNDNMCKRISDLPSRIDNNLFIEF
ncbi:MAG: hypothetical protein LBJ18_00185 [Rickettsiales bacterium]|jgi:hypothetical protein|nr:hypothetical protein [Rickettsiales bacterium]